MSGRTSSSDYRGSERHHWAHDNRVDLDSRHHYYQNRNDDDFDDDLNWRKKTYSSMGEKVAHREAQHDQGGSKHHLSDTGVRSRDSNHKNSRRLREEENESERQEDECHREDRRERRREKDENKEEKSRTRHEEKERRRKRSLESIYHHHDYSGRSVSKKSHYLDRYQLDKNEVRNENRKESMKRRSISRTREGDSSTRRNSPGMEARRHHEGRSSKRPIGEREEDYRESKRIKARDDKERRYESPISHSPTDRHPQGLSRTAETSQTSRDSGRPRSGKQDRSSTLTSTRDSISPQRKKQPRSESLDRVEGSAPKKKKHDSNNELCQPSEISPFQSLSVDLPSQPVSPLMVGHTSRNSPKKAPLTTEEKKLLRLEKIKKLMELKKTQGLVLEPQSVQQSTTSVQQSTTTTTTDASINEVPMTLIKVAFAASSASEATSEKVRSVASAESAFESWDSTAMTSTIVESPQLIAASLKEEEEKAAAAMTFETNDVNAVDSLDAFMTVISTEVDELAELDKNKLSKRKRRKKMGNYIAPSIPSQSITLEEILSLQRKSDQQPHVSNEESEDLIFDDEEAPKNSLSIELSSTQQSSGIDMSVWDCGNNRPSSAEKIFTVNKPGGSARTATLSDSSATNEDQEKPTAGEGRTTSAVPDSSSLVGGTVVEEDEGEDLYYQQFVAEMKKRQQEEAEKAKKEKEEKEAAATAHAALTAQQTNESEQNEEEIAVIPGASDEDGEIRGLMIEEEEDYRYNVPEDSSLNEAGYFALAEKVGNKKELPQIDHSKIEYSKIKKNLYIQVREITLMKEHEVDALRKLHGGIRVRGKMCPRPIRTFYQCGLPDAVLKVIEKREYLEPFPIQMQGLPALMAGRDVIGVAETGSGKTLAYLLPLLRHMLDQPPIRNGEGPIGLVLVPTRELAVQIQKEGSRFAKVLGLRSVSVYGGTGIGEQLSALKRGTEMIVATPGRLIDVLTINNGKVTNLRRVTFVVLDEADRMFDLGFEPQITAILKNIRPDRQTAMFSATFPPHIETLARKILVKPVEITVGEKGQTAHRIEQYVEVWPGSNEKFLRLLQLLGEWNDHGSIIIFVARQTEADNLFADLLKMGYPSLVLHGGQDQTDRDFTIQDFKEGKSNILIATSVAARGLDVKSVVLVINYATPDHLEDYVHRIGRTGRAGNIGVAYTFITPEESEKADDLIKALKQSGKDIPPPLQQLEDQFRVECNLGLQQKRKGKGFGGKGYKFTSSEQSRQQQERQKMKKDLGMEDEKEEELAAIDADEEMDNPMAPLPPVVSQLAGGAAPSSGIIPGVSAVGADVSTASARAKALAELAIRAVPSATSTTVASTDTIKTGDVRGKRLEAMLSSLRQRVATAVGSSTTLSVGGSGSVVGTVPGLSSAGYIDPATGNSVDEFEINDYPQDARQRITNKSVLSRIAEATGSALQVKGRYVPLEEKDSPLMIGVKRLYIEIIGSTPIAVQLSKHEIRSLIEQIAKKQLNLPSKPTTGRYSVV